MSGVKSSDQGATYPQESSIAIEKKQEVHHLETHKAWESGDADGVNAHNNVGLAVLEQKHVIPSTGRRIPTSKWEYATFCIFVSRDTGLRSLYSSPSHTQQLLTDRPSIFPSTVLVGSSQIMARTSWF